MHAPARAPSRPFAREPFPLPHIRWVLHPLSRPCLQSARGTTSSVTLGVPHPHSLSHRRGPPVRVPLLQWSSVPARSILRRGYWPPSYPVAAGQPRLHSEKPHPSC